MVKLENPAHPLTNQEIDALERRLGAQLPGEYRAFLLRNNGGDPKPNDLKIIHDGKIRKWIWVNSFLAVTPGDAPWGDLETVYDWMDGEFPAGAKIIAYGAESDYFLLFISGHRQGQVWHKDLNLCVMDEGSDPEEQMHFLAPSFDKFLSMLTVKPEDAPFEEPI